MTYNNKNLLQIIGVSHSVPDEYCSARCHEDYKMVLKHLASNISSGERVGIEAWEHSLKEIFSWNGNNIDGNDIDCCQNFLKAICGQLQSQGAMPVPLEAKRVYRIITRRMRQKTQEEGMDLIEADHLFQKLNVYRSVRLLDMAYQRKCDALIVGAQHAYDLSLLGYPAVDLVISLKGWQEYQKNVVEKYARPWMYERVKHLAGGKA